jgi:hypothetical protein
MNVTGASWLGDLGRVSDPCLCLPACPCHGAQVMDTHVCHGLACHGLAPCPAPVLPRSCLTCPGLARRSATGNDPHNKGDH